MKELSCEYIAPAGAPVQQVGFLAHYADADTAPEAHFGSDRAVGEQVAQGLLQQVEPRARAARVGRPACTA